MSAGHDPVAAAGVSANEALTGISLLGGGDDFERARLAPVVAAALRAALDLLIGDLPARRPLIVGGDDAALEVRVDAVDPVGLAPAGAVLDAAGASLGPSDLRAGSWVVRAPVLGGRGTYLMVEQGTLSLAVPWSAVARVRMIASDAIEATARRQGIPVLSPFADSARVAPERPVIVIAQGLRRAFLVADRLVWRLQAEPIPGAETRGGKLSRAVATTDGEVYWVVETESLLRGVPPIPLPEMARDQRAHAPPVEEPAPEPPRPPQPAAPERPRLSLVELRTEDVEPIDELSPAEPATEDVPFAAPDPPPTIEPDPQPLAVHEPDPVAPASEPDPEPAGVAPAPDPAAKAAAAPRALVAEDSITARIFLERLLAQRGFEVTGVATARELRHALDAPGTRWAAVFVDVDLPDARGAEHLRGIAARTGGDGSRVVALVRDVMDERRAAGEGIGRALWKPFDGEELDRLLARLRAQAG